MPKYQEISRGPARDAHGNPDPNDPWFQRAGAGWAAGGHVIGLAIGTIAKGFLLSVGFMLAVALFRSMA